ncbi:hypothetical protein [Oerskovia flava]|uniref:hypothetical protein n=1 Tax=Oerskovia flava TaxID=2986422 RepID=UPI00223FFC92|nr:hypothetical protein [Oerskovia sp. JB1-3-2]
MSQLPALALPAATDLGVPGAALPGGPGWAAGVLAETSDPFPAPTDPLRPDLEPTDVSPGLPGFLAIFLLAVACVGLFLGLSRQLRRMNHNAQQRGAEPDQGETIVDTSGDTSAKASGDEPHGGSAPSRDA